MKKVFPAPHSANNPIERGGSTSFAAITVTPVFVADLHVEGERMPVYVHVIDHPDARVLVDTGMTQLHPLLADMDPRLRPLNEQDFDLGAVDMVVNTHLHGDHFDRIARADHGRVGFAEEDRLARSRQSTLLGMRGVVPRQGNDLTRPRKRRPERQAGAPTPVGASRTGVPPAASRPLAPAPR